MESLTQVIIFSNWLILAGMFMLMNIAYTDTHVLTMERLVLGTISVFFAQGFVVWSWMPVVVQNIFIELGTSKTFSKFLIEFSHNELVYSNALVFITLAATWGVINPTHQDLLENNILKITFFVIFLSIIFGLPSWGIPITATMCWVSNYICNCKNKSKLNFQLGVIDVAPILLVGSVFACCVFTRNSSLYFLCLSQILLTTVLVSALTSYFLYIEFRYKTSYKFQLQLVSQVDELIASKRRADEIAKSKDDFLSTMSHEIRTPLNGVMASTYIISQTHLLPEQASYVNMIQVSGENLMLLIDDVLDLPALEAGRVVFDQKPSDLRECLERVADVVAVRFLDKPVDLIIDVDNKIPQMLIFDPKRLSQVLINLVNNAIKFTSQGSVKVKATLENGADHSVTLCIKVEDTGIGISPENQVKIFQAYGQASASISREYGGTGLGLNICKKIIEALNGNIWVESELGKGSTFAFRLRLSLPREQSLLPAPTTYPHKIVSIVQSSALREHLLATLSPYSAQCLVFSQCDLSPLEQFDADENFIFIVCDTCYQDDLKRFIESKKKIYPVLLTKRSLGVKKQGLPFKLGAIKKSYFHFFIDWC